MGRSGSSSKRKHSKKKSVKVSSEVRRKKRSRRTKSKKLRHHDDSFSSYSDDESTSSSLLSSSSSEDDYKSRKSRSRSRNELKSTTKKRTRKRSCSEDSTNDSPPVKKRKRSKKKTDSDKKKNKKKIKKKSRKDVYTSSSSDSASCSTSGDEDGSSDEDTHKGKTGKRKDKSRTTRSFSPNYDDGDDNIENIPVENNPRRLKSVITIATQPENEEVDDMKRDEHKEEMVYDHDYDYPSCKSNDSNDDETKKELVEKDKNGGDNLESGVDDLEAILRQKALENLSRFRGGLQSKPLVNVDNKQKQDQSGVDLGQSSVDPGQGGVDLGQTSVLQPGIQRRSFTWRRDDSVKEKVENKIENETSTNNSEVEKSTVELEKSKGQQSEGNENSQFEKKTMSVMRGGEMVQVSYKVYIPNRAPALARRQLKR